MGIGLAYWYVLGHPMNELESPGALSTFIQTETNPSKARTQAATLARAIALCHDVLPSSICLMG